EPSPINVDTSTSNRGALCAKVCPQGSVRGDARKGVPYRDGARRPPSIWPRGGHSGRSFFV
ncbi:MAG: hypothetical protein LBT47_02420, partial [Deltaproteobacteria bacterium]|nr:hypothetical protein [Deltaproteobacteria bacterium]